MIIATAAEGFFRHLDAGKWADIGQATNDTMLMLAGSLPLTLAIGLPLGVLLFLTGSPRSCTACRWSSASPHCW